MKDKNIRDEIIKHNKEYKKIHLPEWFGSYSISNEAMDDGSYAKYFDAFHKKIWGDDHEDEEKSIGELNDEIGLSHSDYTIMLCSYLEGAGVARLDFNFKKKEFNI